MAALAALATSAISANPAQACSVVSGYRVPTNLELVDKAPLILRARVVGEVEGEDAWDRKLVVEPVEALKGTMPEGRLEISGNSLVPDDDERGFGLLSNPYELADAHPLSYIGGCTRYMFPRGTIALFFLEWRDGAWRGAGDPFSRWAEDVIEDDAPWIRLVRFYVRVAAAPADARAAMLEAERNRLAALADDPVATLMAKEIERQLAGANPTWHEIMRGAIEHGSELPSGAEAEAAAEAISDFIMSIGGLEGDQADAMEEAEVAVPPSSDHF